MGNKLFKEQYSLLAHQDAPAISCPTCMKACDSECALAIHSLVHNTFDKHTNWRNTPEPDVLVYWTYSSLSRDGYYFMKAVDCNVIEKAFQAGESTSQTSGKYPFIIDFVQGKQIGAKNSREIQRITREHYDQIKNDIFWV